MNKRLRKKKHVGEFQELGFEVGFEFAAASAVVDRLDIVYGLIDLIENRGLSCGGVGGGTRAGFFVQKWPRGKCTEQDRIAVREWLQRQDLVADTTIGPLRDAWYGWDDE